MPNPYKYVMRKVLKLFMRLPDGIGEDPLEFLVCITLALAGILELVLPLILEPLRFSHATEVPLPIIIWLTLSLVLGGISAALGCSFRGTKIARYFVRMLESMGLTFLSSGTLALGIIQCLGIKSLAGFVSAALLLALGIGLGARAIIVTPGIYERILRREMDREIQKTIER